MPRPGCSPRSRPSTRGRAPSCRSGRTRGGAASWSPKLGAVPGSLVLDVAAGTGLVSRELAARRRVERGRARPERADAPGGPAGERRGRARRSHPSRARASRGAAVRRRHVRCAHVHLSRALRGRSGRDARASSLGSCAPAARSRRSSSTCLSSRCCERAGTRTRAGCFPCSDRSSRPGGVARAASSVRASSRLEQRAPLPEQVRWWQEAGIRHVRSRELTLGAAVVIWGVKEGRRG